ncbi:MAG: PEP-CTERM system TPR-repeat protein PrsT [Gammaproteobacteria bacterium]|nr:PEP-CTERM system TPR-repeat protein PrsT [Gammaproteobacteria bacterium]MBU1977941.1 PEP-CTERM system TPR-repeat protein PrsT [Gammaproteobacteria bacterium]
MHNFGSNKRVNKWVMLLTIVVLIGGGTTACSKVENTQALISQAKQFQQKGDNQAAIIQLKNALQKTPDDAEARYLLGMIYQETGDPASAEKELRKALALGMGRDKVAPGLGKVLLVQGQFQNVLDETDQTAAKKPTSPEILGLRGNAYLGLGKHQDAKQSFEQALQSRADFADALLGMARLAIADKNIDAAVSFTDLAVNKNPKNIDAWLFKGDLLRAQGKIEPALDAYGETLKIMPDNTSARLSRASVELAAGKFDAARADIEAARKKEPKNLMVGYLQALLDFRQGKHAAARDSLQQIMRVAPNHMPSVLLAGAVQFYLGSLQQAEQHLKTYLGNDPNSLYARKLLATTQLRQGQPDEAARTLVPLDPDNSNDAGVQIIAAEIALTKKQFAQASVHFEKAAQINPSNAAIRTELGLSRMAQGDKRALADLQIASGLEDESGRADIFIVLSQIKNKQYDAALTSIAVLEKKIPQSPLPWNYRAAAYLGKKDIAKARDSLEHALKLDPKFFPAAANLAQLDLKDGQTTNARKRFEAILKADPKHLQAMLAMADLSLLQKDEKAYTSWLEKAAIANPQAIQPNLLLARYLLAKGENTKAVLAAREAVNAQPKNPTALDLLGTAQFASKDLSNALDTYRKLANQLPNQAEPRLKLAQVQIAMKQPGDARKTLQEALGMKPDLIEAQLMLGVLEIQSARYDEAHKIAKQIQQRQPASPAGLVLEGDIALARKQYTAALAAFERAHKLSPSPATLIRLHQALVGTGRFEEGEKRLASWLASHPQDGGTRLYLAEHLIARGAFKAASEHYLLQNQQSPGNLIVLNNLAWALSELKDNRALSYAEQALKLKPDNPTIMDTLGWILVQQGQTERGIKLLQQALSKVPDAGSIHWHLAYGFYRAGDRTHARQELKRLLDSGLGFPEEAGARELLKQLGG